MRSEDCSSPVCVPVCLSTTMYAHDAKRLGLYMDINSFFQGCKCSKNKMCDFPAAAFKRQKLAVSLTKPPSPTHQSMLHMRIYILTVLLSRRYGKNTSDIMEASVRKDSQSSLAKLSVVKK